MEYISDEPLFEGGTYPTPPSPPLMDEYSPNLTDESIFKNKEAKEKSCGIDEASMEKDEGAKVRR